MSKPAGRTELCVSLDSCEPWILPLSTSELRRALELMLEAMPPAPGGAPPGLLELSVLDDPGMAALNYDFLGLGGPTNVLAFPGPAASLALAAQTICREAWLYGQEPAAYTLKMLGHGLAHIMGYEHGPKMDTEVERAAAKAAALFYY